MSAALPDPLDPDDSEDTPEELKGILGGQTRTEAAVALLIAGASDREIARVLKYSSPARARAAAEKALASTASEQDKAKRRLVMERRLEAMIRSHWEAANDPKDPGSVNAAKIVGQNIDRLARLFGLNEPTEVSVHTPTHVELSTWVFNVLQVAQAGLPQERDINAIEEAEIVEDGDEDDVAGQGDEQSEGESAPEVSEGADDEVADGHDV